MTSATRHDGALDVISAGAAKGIVGALAGRFRELQGVTVAGTFGAVGAMREKLVGGAACDVVILTQAMLEGLVRERHVLGETLRPLGRVYTGVAIRAGDPVPAVATGPLLREHLAAATSVYLPDPEKSTAGIHFMSVLDRLGLRDDVAARLKPFANGALAMSALAGASDALPLGCTQVTEIKYTPGVTLAGLLPSEFELATLYSAAVCARARDTGIAARFVELITGPDTRTLRADGGFEA